MKQFFFLISFVMLYPAIGFSQSAETKALEILKKYSPDGYEIITDYRQAPASYKIGDVTMSFFKNNRFKRYLATRNEHALINSLSTAVHEMNHAYTGLCAYRHLKTIGVDENYECYYLDGGKYMIVKLTETFPVTKMSSQVSKKLRTLRYETYMGKPMKFQSTQTSGVYGLLNEFNAYYQGCKTTYNLYDYYRDETEGKVSDWQLWMQDFDGSFYAYAEFRYYILLYLIHAEKNEKEIYEDIIQNAEFKQVFNYVDKAFSQLIADYQTRRAKLLDEFEKQKLFVSIDDEMTSIGNYATANFQADYKILMKEMQKPQYRKMLQNLQE
jgi:hypothetical protein